MLCSASGALNPFYSVAPLAALLPAARCNRGERRGGVTVGRQGAAAAWPARREIGRWRVGGGGPQLGFGVIGRANQAAGGAAALPLSGRPRWAQRRARAPACAASGARVLPAWVASSGGPGVFFGQRPVKGPAGPMAARFMRPRKRLAHVPTAHQAPAHGQLRARAGPGPGQSRAGLS
jgi:hypothetical protein